MVALEFGLVCLTLFGSAALCIHVFNHSHARYLPRWLYKSVNLIIQAWFLLVPVALIVGYLRADRGLFAMLRAFEPIVPVTYVTLCLITAVVTMWQISRRPRPDSAAALTANHTTRLNLRRQLGPGCVNDPILRPISALPGNQLLELFIHEKTIRIERLPERLAGLTITHLTDLHFTGKVAKPYFEEVIRRANAMDSDLIAVTGDLIDKAACLDWIPDTFGQLQARYGVYFILGNHDLRVDGADLRGRLTDAGLKDVGGRWLEVAVNETPVILAGSEVPWFLPAADLSDCRPRGKREQLRILLTHSPDQIAWALDADADLILAGHTHGGQIRLPLIGPLASSSRMGTRYAGGVYDVPPAVLHVCRGISSTFPIRYNCPPELARLELRR